MPIGFIAAVAAASASITNRQPFEIAGLKRQFHLPLIHVLFPKSLRLLKIKFGHDLCVATPTHRRRITRRHIGDGGHVRKIIFASALLLTIGAGAASATPSICNGTAGNLIQNCGFETGNFSGWNTGPASSGSFFGVDGPGYSGSFEAYFGATAGIPDAIFQTVQTTPGHLYDLQFYFKSDGLTPNGAFVGYFDTSFHVLGGAPDIPLMDWTLEDFTFTPSTPFTQIKFGAQDGPGFLLVDDFVLKDVTVPEPFTLGIFGVGLAGAVVMRRSKNNSV